MATQPALHHRGIERRLLRGAEERQAPLNIKAILMIKAAKSSTAPSAARLDFFDQKLPVSATPTERQISRSRSSITAQTRIDAPGESPA